MEDIKEYIDDILSDHTLGKEKPDAIALLILYHNTLQPINAGNKTAYATQIKVADAVELLGISDRRVRKAKRVLEGAGLLNTISTKDSDAKTIHHYIELLT